MSTLSVPLTPQLEEMINRLVKSGHADNRASLVRKAIKYFAEEQAVAEVLKAKQEYAEGKFFTGDIRKIIKKLPRD